MSRASRPRDPSVPFLRSVSRKFRLTWLSGRPERSYNTFRAMHGHYSLAFTFHRVVHLNTIDNNPSNVTVVSSPPSVAGGQVYPEQEFEALQRKLVALDAEIEELTQEGCQLDELEVHIEKMHEYNEVKDVAQMLLGRLAVVRGVTTRDLYEDYNLQLED
uniref:DNA repair protein SWI5 homolog n=1 Tax=Eptatretus burgeri TaxID=7764 RepID=A0A8C4Q302_EPTBU